MRFLLTICLLIVFSEISTAQDYERVDTLVENYPTNYKEPKNLASKISEDFTNEFDQVRAVYNWIAYNVAYDWNEEQRNGIIYYSKDDLIQKERIYQSKLSKRVISKKKAICEGYSYLFKELCDQLNIECTVVIGGAKTEIKDIYSSWASDHAWNVVSINNNKYLIDVTWGAGSMDGKTFERDPNYTYFFTDPNDLIKNHYPEDYKNSLLNKKITKKNFLRAPLIYGIAFKKFELIGPDKSGVLRSNTEVEFSFKTSIPITWICYTLDEVTYQVDTFSHQSNALNFTIDLNGKRGRNLTLFLNGEATVGYQVRK